MYRLVLEARSRIRSREYVVFVGLASPFEIRNQLVLPSCFSENPESVGIDIEQKCEGFVACLGKEDTPGSSGYAALSEKSSKTFSCPASPSASRTASWKSLNEYRSIAGGVSAPFDNMVRRWLVAARTSASGWEGTQRGSHHPRTVAVE